MQVIVCGHFSKKFRGTQSPLKTQFRKSVLDHVKNIGNYKQRDRILWNGKSKEGFDTEMHSLSIYYPDMQKPLTKTTVWPVICWFNLLLLLTGHLLYSATRVGSQRKENGVRTEVQPQINLINTLIIYPGKRGWTNNSPAFQGCTACQGLHLPYPTHTSALTDKSWIFLSLFYRGDRKVNESHKKRWDMKAISESEPWGMSLIYNTS